ncbi:MAG TPA: DUF6152 family protein [Bryobacteraceae bacterium]|jgi:hypothetical protein|nr:DUF6152 family protein [Bryobacteraceae bacterium]
MQSRLLKVAVSAGLLVAAALPLAAHHSFSAEFDATKQVTLEGKVVEMEWVNPHSWLTIDVAKPDGAMERWRIEGGSPSVLLRLGWNRNSLPAGTKIKVIGFQAKDGSFRASSRDIEFPDGRKMDLGGSSNTENDKK